MDRLRGIFTAVTGHRVFLPALVAAVAVILGAMLAFEHSRNLIKVRGPYVILLAAIMAFPVFAFRFFDPHEDSLLITAYFIASGLYFVLLGSPNFVTAFDAVLRNQLSFAGVKALGFGVVALAAISGTIHYAIKFSRDEHLQQGHGVLTISPVKFVVYAVMQMIYLNATVMLLREKFGILTAFVTPL